MPDKIIIVQNKAGDKSFPITHERAVRDSAGVSIENKFASLGIKNRIVAWDGGSPPVVSSIPAGVEITYNGVTYTGTLAASLSTNGKVYLVKNGIEYDRYFSSQILNGNYVWSKCGTTADAREIVEYIMPETNEAGFFIVDENCNIGLRLDNAGIHAKNVIEFEVIL